MQRAYESGLKLLATLSSLLAGIDAKAGALAGR